MTFDLIWQCNVCGREMTTPHKNVQEIGAQGKRRSVLASVPTFCIWCKVVAEKGEQK